VPSNPVKKIQNLKEGEIFDSKDEIEHYSGNKHSPFMTKDEQKQLMGGFKAHTRNATESAQTNSNNGKHSGIISKETAKHYRTNDRENNGQHIDQILENAQQDIFNRYSQ